jgi:hypothetical protein
MSMQTGLWRKKVLSRSAILCAVIALAACTTVTSAETLGPVQLVHGEQLKIWGVEARRDEQDVRLTGQVDRGALPRGLLRQHVHLEILDTTGAVIATQDAALYPYTALREMGTARLSATISGDALGADDVLQLRVVDGVPHD